MDAAQRLAYVQKAGGVWGAARQYIVENNPSRADQVRSHDVHYAIYDWQWDLFEQRGVKSWGGDLKFPALATHSAIDYFISLPRRNRMRSYYLSQIATTLDATLTDVQAQAIADTFGTGYLHHKTKLHPKVESRITCPVHAPQIQHADVTNIERWAAEEKRKIVWLSVYTNTLADVPLGARTAPSLLITPGWTTGSWLVAYRDYIGVHASSAMWVARMAPIEYLRWLICPTAAKLGVRVRKRTRFEIDFRLTEIDGDSTFYDRWTGYTVETAGIVDAIQYQSFPMPTKAEGWAWLWNKTTSEHRRNFILKHIDLVSILGD